MLYFAHNGVDHATEVESSTHQTGSMFWIIAITLVTAVMMYAVIKLLSKQEAKNKDK
jgi:hypothetical protein